MKAVQKITLDIAQGSLPVTVFAKQYDNKTRFIEITLTNGGVLYEIPSGVTARFRLTKGDKTVIFNDASIASGVITAELTEQALAASGIAVAEIGLYQGAAILTTQIFYIDVKASAMNEKQVMSSNEYGSLTNAIATAEAAEGTARQAVEIANAASTTATTAANKANTATGAATTAATNANNAAERAENAVDTLENKFIKKYSVSFTGSASKGTREDNAVGMQVGVQIGADGSGVVNDFDSVPFFNRPICCCSWDATTRKWRVNAYKGEPGFANDGSNGEVMYECTPFYYKADFSGSGAPSYVSVTGTPCEGYTLAPMFPDANTKVYCPSYWLAMVDGKATSRSGVFPAYNSLNGFMTQARTFDERGHTETIEALFSDYLLMLVEFATKDFQTVMLGACSMRYVATDTITEVISSTQFKTTAAIGALYLDGQSIAIGTAAYSGSKKEGVIVISIVTEGGESTFTLAAEVPTMAAGDFISSRPWTNGATDFVTASSGTMANNNKYPLIWRGKVDAWADAFSFLCNLLVKRYGAGTEAEPYTYKYEYLPEPWKYANGTITADYIEANYELPGTDGYAKTISEDSRYPFLIGTTELGAGSTNYAAAYFYYSRNAVSAVRVGGTVFNGRNCSPVFFYLNDTPSYSSWNSRARLFVSP